MRFRSLLAAGLLVFAPVMAGDKIFTTDTNHTVLGFKASTLLFDVPGRFNRYKVAIQGDPATPSTVEIRVEIDVKSINTSNKMRDEHLRTGEFFDVAAFPKIVFTSTKAWRQGDKIEVQGALEMHGRKKDLQIEFQEATGLNGAGMPTWSYKATLPLNRKDFWIGTDSVGAKISLKDEVQLDLLLVGFFNDPEPEPVKKVPAKARAAAGTK